MNKTPSSRVVSFDNRKHLPQSFAEKTNDLYYIMSALYFAERQQKNLTKLTLQKILYKVSQTIAEEKQLMFFSTFFYVNTQGPFNKQIYLYSEELEEANLIRINKNDIYLTTKGENLIEQLIEESNNDPQLVTVLTELQRQTGIYAGNPTQAVNDTHKQMVIDSTDGNKIKNIETIIEEISPQERFTSPNQFKYIEPSTMKSSKKYNLPALIINKIETVVAGVTPSDYETSDNSLVSLLGI